MWLMDKMMKKNKQKSPDLAIAISSEAPMTEEVTQEMPQETSPIMAEPDMTPPMDAQMEEELYSNYDDGDEEAIIELGPLGSIYEYVEPLAIRASDRQFVEFMHDLFTARKSMLENL